MSTSTTVAPSTPSISQAASPRRRRRSLAPGLVAGYVLSYLVLVVLLPLSGLFVRAASLSRDELAKAITSPRVLAALEVSFTSSLFAAMANVGFGLLVAWVLVRYRFPGRRLVDALIDLPFALPTAVAGIALTAVYAQDGVLGAPLEALGLKVAFTRVGITLALVFVGLPFVVRTVQPVIEDLDPAMEEAALCLGASRFETFRRVIFPELVPALAAGFTLALARGLGEYGSVVFISGNMPMQTEIVPLVIITKLEQYDYAGATAVAALTLVVSFAMLLLLNGLAWLGRRRAAPELA